MSEINEKVEPQPIDLGEYKFGFHDDVKPIYSTGKGLNEAVIRELSAAKGEPEWMLDFRLKSLETFNKMPMQTWGADLSDIDFDDSGAKDFNSLSSKDREKLEKEIEKNGGKMFESILKKASK